MANVVLCSELGRDSRFLAKLADCVVELQAQGHSVRLVCSDVTAAHMLPEFKKVSIFQSPKPDLSIAGESKSKARMKNYSSLLMSKGYHDAAALTPILRAWLHLLATLDADMVITDHAPTALLAGKLLMIPCVMMGTGYTVPPRENPLPSFTPWKSGQAEGDTPDPELLAEDKQLLAVVNQSIKDLNFDKVELKEAQDIYSHAAQWVMTLSEIDHYGRRDVSYTVRWSDSGLAAAPIWPNVPGNKIFVYLEAESPHLPVLLKQLKERGEPVLAVIKGAGQELIDKYRAENINVQAEPVNIRQVVEHCRVLINNSGHNIVYELLMMGVPSVLLPSTIENVLLAYRVAKRKLGFAGPAKPDLMDIDALIKKVGDSDQIWANASRMSMKYQNHESLERLHDLILAKLPPE